MKDSICYDVDQIIEMADEKKKWIVWCGLSSFLLISLLWILLGEFLVKYTLALKISALYHCFNNRFFGQRKSSFKTKQLSFLAVFCTIMFIMYRITKYQYHQEEVWDHLNSLEYHCMYIITKGQNIY